MCSGASSTPPAQGRWTVLWAAVVAVAMLGPALTPGAVLTYDMVWVPDLALTEDVLGLSTGLPRAVPSDAVVALTDEVIPGLWLQKIVLLVSLIAAGAGAGRLVPGPLAARLAAVTLYEWNAFVVERLVIGHWPVLIGYAVLPWLVLAARRLRPGARLPASYLLLLPLGSLSASAGLVSAVMALAVAWGRGRRRVLLLVLAAANAPWVVAGAIRAGAATTDPAGAQAFALNDEGPVPGPIAALTLGGIWNSEVVPTSRTGALGWIALGVIVTLVGLGVRRWWAHEPACGGARRERIALLVCWGIGWGIATLTWLAPGAVGVLGAWVPGGGVIRDGSRMLGLCAPLLVVLVGHGVARLVVTLGGRSSSGAASRSATIALTVAASLTPIALLPDAAGGVGGRLEPASYPSSWAEARADLAAADPPGDLLVLPLTPFRRPAWNHDRTVFDPLGRYLGRPFVASDVLVVSGTVISGEDPRVSAAADALAAPDPRARAGALADLGIGATVLDRSAVGANEVPEIAGSTLSDGGDLVVTRLPGEPVARETAVADRVAVGVAWAVYAGLLLAAAGAGIGTGIGVVRHIRRSR